MFGKAGIQNQNKEHDGEAQSLLTIRRVKLTSRRMVGVCACDMAGGGEEKKMLTLKKCLVNSQYKLKF